MWANSERVDLEHAISQHLNKTIRLTEGLCQPSLLTGAVAVAPGECHAL